MSNRIDKSLIAVLFPIIIFGFVPTTISHDSVEVPTFSNPAHITNPFFPLSTMDHTISLGKRENINVRIEVTSLAQTRTIEWGGGQIETVVAQFVEYADDRMIEVAYDYFAQSDDGSVYYLGEDVTNYENGVVLNHEGSWLTGRDGAPPALIMPAKPAVGQIFNSENLPGIVYETDKVLSLTEKIMIPSGPISDGLLIEETLMDGAIEYKVYAAGFGIVEERDGDERVNLALFTKSESTPGIVPDSLQAIEAQAEDIIDITPSGNWTRVADDVDAIVKAWQTYQASSSENSVPQTFRDALTVALTRLKETSAAKNTINTLQSANMLSAAVVDLFNLYHPVIPADLGWLDVLERQTVFDSMANHLSSAANSIATANAIWVRLRSSVLAHNGTATALEFEANLYAQRAALIAKNSSKLVEAANGALEIVDSLEQLY